MRWNMLPRQRCRRRCRVDASNRWRHGDEAARASDGPAGPGHRTPATMLALDERDRYLMASSATAMVTTAMKIDTSTADIFHIRCILSSALLAVAQVRPPNFVSLTKWRRPSAGRRCWRSRSATANKRSRRAPRIRGRSIRRVAPRPKTPCAVNRQRAIGRQ